MNILDTPKIEPVQLASDDILVLKPEQAEILHQCCDCGLKHRILVSPRSSDLRLQFIRQDHGFDFSKYDVQTFIEKET